MRIEPTTSPLPRVCSTTEPHGRYFRQQTNSRVLNKLPIPTSRVDLQDELKTNLKTQLRRISQLNFKDAFEGVELENLAGEEFVDK